MWYVEYNLKNKESKKGQGIRGKKPTKLLIDNSVVITRGKEKWREVEELGKGGDYSDEMKLDLG